MIGNSVKLSPDLGPHASVFTDIVTVEEVKRFKPHSEVYQYLAKKVGKGTASMADIWLVSANPFDVVGARSVGMQSCWVDRSHIGWTDQLVQSDEGRPTVIVQRLQDVVDIITKHTGLPRDESSESV